MSAWERRLDDLKRRAAGASPVAGATGDNRVGEVVRGWEVLLSLSPMGSERAPRWHLSFAPAAGPRGTDAFPAAAAAHLGAPSEPMLRSPNGVVHYQWEGEVSEPGLPAAAPSDPSRYRVLRLMRDGSQATVGHALDEWTATSLAALDAGWSRPGIDAWAEAGAARVEIRRRWAEGMPSPADGGETRYYAVVDQAEGTAFFLPDAPPWDSGVGPPKEAG